ncbi:redoxin domain-containing protein [Pseudochryseolinea flava]|uniref:Alkyl hydroperoxide reductase subunit C/ Thiol specific antioxidant domain-containing protein n=1 Tax=Pseudochryseolinea flava TaxID=2059302 RepID=A0A364Y0V8_9BACT|nr:redoxin domain-containing protein [Pseudochryseolinea flava]RAV99902.1 hypothetical protein DQQ10_17845 [Pseudochryseolinea flava]
MTTKLVLTFFIIGVGLKTHGQLSMPSELFIADKINVVVFLSVDCPISQKYIGTLNELLGERSGQVVITGIIPGRVQKSDVKKFKQEYKIAFKIVRDENYHFTDWFKAGFTPEVFVFNTHQKFIYQGAVDNWFYDLGSYRQQITENYLRDVITAEVEGQNPSFKKTETVGCIIQKPVKR